MSTKYFSPDRTMEVKLEMTPERYYIALLRCVRAGYGVKEARLLIWMYKKHYYTAISCALPYRSLQYSPTARY